MAAATPTLLESTGEILARLWPKTQDGTATDLEAEALVAIRDLRDEVQRMLNRIETAKRSMDNAKSHLDGAWG